MTETAEQLLGAVRTYVTDVFQHRVKPEFVFHNLDHTEEVVEACSQMADHYQLKDDDRLVLMAAAWFHDVGYAAGAAEGHEEASIQMATKFLQSHGADETLVQRVGSCINATRMPQSPVNLIEKILCDADLHHLSTADFQARNQLLKKEREALVGHKIDKKEWRKGNRRFLLHHQYFTDYGQQALAPKKAENLTLFEKSAVEKKGVKAKPKAAEVEAFPYKSETVAQKERMEAKNTERGIQTMFRTTSNNHIELSGMADNKAHIMITVNSIILSVTISYFLPRVVHDVKLMIATIILALTCLISVTCSILATRPSINNGRFTEDDIRNKKTNLLFFGNFHKMALSDYQWGVNQMLKDREYLYNTMMMDIYFLGVVLAKKYRYLRIAYTVFMVGLILAVIAFGIASLVPDAAVPSSVETIDYP